LAEFNVPYLESLSTGELIELAGKYDLDIPPGLDRIFIIEELLYLDEGNDHTGGEEVEVETAAAGTFEVLAALPKQYNISYIDVIIRDPLWAFVFWEIKVYDRELYENTAGFESYCLRVIPLGKDDGQPNRAAAFTIAVGPNDHAWYVGFPPDSGCYFIIELCVLTRGNSTVLAVSRSFKLPRLIKPEDVQAACRNPLAKLSGVDRFSLVRSEDRILRSRG